MQRASKFWRASIIVFISSFSVMVIELLAGRLLAPYIGVSLYTWTSIIGVILAGIALGNYLGGRIADKYPSPLVLVGVFFIGGLLTIAVLPTTKLVANATWFANLPVLLEFTFKVSMIFLLPAIILSMVTPVVIKLTLGDLGRTGGIVGTIYAVSTAGSIFGTFLTGFYFILWFGVRTIFWLVAAVLILTGILAWFSWKIPGRWKFSLKNFITWITAIEVIIISIFMFQFRNSWQEDFTKESNYYSIKIWSWGEVKGLRLDYIMHAFVIPNEPLNLQYDYLKILAEMTSYLARENPEPKTLHLGGGGYCFPRYLEAVYPKSVNDVVEIDPAVTQVVYEELGLPADTSIKTYNEDARRFLIRQKKGNSYDIVVGDVFSERSTPYHLTTLEFDRLVKANMKEDGVYLINIVDDYRRGRYMPSVIYTLRQVFNYVYLFSVKENWSDAGAGRYILAATDRRIDLTEYKNFITENGQRKAISNPLDEISLNKYLTERKAILLTDDYAPTDILVTLLFR